MIHVDIQDIAGKYAAWRKIELEKQKKSAGQTGHTIPTAKILTWIEWKTKADKATADLIANMQQGQPLVFNEDTWKTLKNFLKYLFYNKCAYCEGRFAAGSFMDVEHYRPKAGVTLNHDRSSLVKITAHNGEAIAHPGYYWLAYDPQNLLLACERCNREAKRNQFPIRGSRACTPYDSLDNEQPLLLNPYIEENLVEHFQVVDENSGFLEGKSVEGKKTAAICDLNREDLASSRQEEWEKVKKDLFLAFLAEKKQCVHEQMQYSLYLKLSLKSALNKMSSF